jgi:hypothetical protein
MTCAYSANMPTAVAMAFAPPVFVGATTLVVVGPEVVYEWLEDGDGVLVAMRLDSMVVELLVMAEVVVVGLRMLERETFPEADAVVIGRVAFAVAGSVVAAEEVQEPTS